MNAQNYPTINKGWLMSLPICNIAIYYNYKVLFYTALQVVYVLNYCTAGSSISLFTWKCLETDTPRQQQAT